MRYFKGYDKEHPDHRVILRLYDEPQNLMKILFNSEDYIIEVEYIDHSGITRYESVEDCEEHYYIAREITEEEYDLYKDTQTIINEVFLNQFTYGFPNESNVKRAVASIRANVNQLLKEMK
jgi:hypothetical protein